MSGSPGGGVELRRLERDGGPAAVCAVDPAGAHPLPVATMADLLAMPVTRARELVDAALARPTDTTLAGARTLAPVDGLTEVWACGVTYRRSREARAQESREADVYERVYDAARPELFLKSLAHKVVADGDPVGIRHDSTLDVPEPELALVLTGAGEVLGYTVCNDMSSRSIEGENPLYLPQAKIYAGACALGPAIRPAWELDAARVVAGLGVSLLVEREGRSAFAGSTSTAELHRRCEDLVEHLFRADVFPAGAVLSTGTGVVPGMDFTLQPGDLVTITIDGVGTLTNPVTRTRPPGP